MPQAESHVVDPHVLRGVDVLRPRRGLRDKVTGNQLGGFPRGVFASTVRSVQGQLNVDACLSAHRTVTYLLGRHLQEHRHNVQTMFHVPEGKDIDLAAHVCRVQGVGVNEDNCRSAGVQCPVDGGVDGVTGAEVPAIPPNREAGCPAEGRLTSGGLLPDMPCGSPVPRTPLPRAPPTCAVGRCGSGTPCQDHRAEETARRCAGWAAPASGCKPSPVFGQLAARDAAPDVPSHSHTRPRTVSSPRARGTHSPLVRGLQGSHPLVPHKRFGQMADDA